MDTNENKLVSVKIWDLPLRIFHWLLVISVIVMFISANFGFFDVHIFTGKCIAILLLFRIIWGFVGSSNARFSSLFFHPREYIRYIATLVHRKPSHALRHSPIGSLAVIALLLMVTAQLATGMVASDIDGLVEGPFAYYVSYDFSRWATGIHHTTKKFLIALIVLHLAANAFYYFFKKDNLVGPMISGRRPTPPELASEQPTIAPTWKGIVTILVTATIMIGIFYQWG